MTMLVDLLRKARAAVSRRGLPPDDVEDLVQEAFIRLEGYERANQVRSQEAFLVSTVVNLSIDRARRRQRSPFDRFAPDTETIPDGSAGPDEILQARARLAHLERGLAGLPERTQRILLLRRIDGLGYREIAEAEQMTVSAVEKQIARATLVLMNWMDGW